MVTVGLLLAGGTGTRLAPATAPDRPKQLVALAGDRTPLARTLDRLAFLDRRVVLTSERHAPAVRAEVERVAPGAEVWVEPAARDTGPALAYAAVRARRAFGESTLVCAPTDHRIDGDVAGAVRQMVATAREGWLALLGVAPDRPATGYGYVEPGEPLEATGADRVHRVAAFHEKPGAERAREYCKRGYRWNAGVFAWRPETFLSAARETGLAAATTAARAALAGDEGPFEALESVAVDRALLERTDRAAVVGADLDWRDLGSWAAFYREGLRETEAGDDGRPTVTLGAGDTRAVDAPGTLVAAGEDHRVAAVGVSDLVVAAFDDRVLVVPRAASQRVREVAEFLD